MSTRKEDIITFKVDESLMAQLKRIPNRSEFIRSAIQSALNDTCPLCHGLGHLTTKQREHWEAFSREHALRECDDCNELHLVCTGA